MGMWAMSGIAIAILESPVGIVFRFLRYFLAAEVVVMVVVVVVEEVEVVMLLVMRSLPLLALGRLSNSQ